MVVWFREYLAKWFQGYFVQNIALNRMQIHVQIYNECNTMLYVDKFSNCIKFSTIEQSRRSEQPIKVFLNREVTKYSRSSTTRKMNLPT